VFGFEKRKGAFLGDKRCSCFRQRNQKIEQKVQECQPITDVISFKFGSSPLAGDIYIARQRSKKQAKQAGHSWEKELAYLVIHGTLHLLDYEDYSARGRREMFSKQDKIFQCLFS